MVNEKDIIALIKTLAKERDEAKEEVGKLQFQIWNLQNELRKQKEETERWKKLS